MPAILDTILKVFLGLLGLGLMVFVHEFGHYIAARLSRIEVEAFSIGWGPVFLKWKRRDTEFRLSVFPIGGYCKMKGEYELRKAIEDKAPAFEPSPGSYYAASPWKRIFVGFMGPLFNLVATFLIFVLVALAGSVAPTQSNRIILENDYLAAVGRDLGAPGPAEKAGLRSGDRIVAIDGKAVADATDLAEATVPRPNQTIEVQVDRAGARSSFALTLAEGPGGAGILGVAFWLDPIIGGVGKGSPAESAGILPGDRIVAIDGQPIEEWYGIKRSLLGRPQKIEVDLDRAGALLKKDVYPYTVGEDYIMGVTPRSEAIHVVPPAPFFAALGTGAGDTANLLAQSVKGLASLFSGANPLDNIAGPSRITYMIGEQAVAGAEAGLGNALVLGLRFLGLIGIALFVMNLLPIPALDGGMIVLFIVEIFRRKLPSPRTVYRYQMVGAVFVFALIALALTSDLLHFIR